jgi:hypothetical protein
MTSLDESRSRCAKRISLKEWRDVGCSPLGNAVKDFSCATGGSFVPPVARAPERLTEFLGFFDELLNGFP